jgi:4-hydroxy-4-methyl-2-oxoglutarate aldolase
MADSPMLTIRRDFPRPEASTLKAFAGTPTGFLADALGRSGALDHRIKPVWDAPAFVGTALTVWTTPRDNLAPYAALKVCKPGDVLLVATGEHEGHSVMGDLIIGMLKNAGVVAIITDGVVRDVPGIVEVGIPVYARGVSPNSPFKNGPGGVGVPITIGGDVVESGDIVVGDGDGVVICPRARIGEALEALKSIRAKEAQMDAAVKSGMTVPGWLDGALAERGVNWID